MEINDPIDGLGGGGYKPPKAPTPAAPGPAGTTTSTTAAGIAQNVKAEGLSGDPEAAAYNPNVAWNPGAWVGSGVAPAAPKKEPVGNPPKRVIGVPTKPFKPIADPIRALPHYGQSFSANNGSAGTFDFGGSSKLSEPMLDEEK